MGNSSLVNYTKFSPNHSGKRTHAIDTVSIHCMAGNLTVESCGSLFAQSSYKASSNYGIGSDGRIALYVDEGNWSWCSSNRANDNRAVTIEVANCGGAPDWPVTDQAMQSLIRLLADICRRNGIPELRWKGDKSLIGQPDKQNMTVHRWFAAKACPGDYLYQRHGQIATAVNRLLAAEKRKEDENGTEEQEAKMDIGKLLEELTPEQAARIVDLAQTHIASRPAPDWSEQELARAVAAGITDGTRPQALVTRCESAVMALRAAERRGA